MRKNIHPNYQKLEVTCACGNAFVTYSSYLKSNILKINIVFLSGSFL